VKRSLGQKTILLVLIFTFAVFHVLDAAKGVEDRQSMIMVENFDSGTRVVREVAEALTGNGKSILECYPFGSRLFLSLVSLLPEPARFAAMEWGMRLSVGNSPKKLEGFDVNSLPGWCVGQYPATDRGYEAIVIGSPNGGIAHLAALLHAPFLTTSFGLTFRHPPMDADDLASYHKTGKALTETFLTQSEDESFEVISHYDAFHDRSLVKFVNFIRIKLLALPKSYQEFILKNLASGGTLVLVNCSYSWPQYKIAERFFLQVGGLGGINPEEYMKQWPLDLPIETRRESEWGCPKAFAEAVKGFADQHGLEVLELQFEHPQKYSLLAYNAYLASDSCRQDEVLFDCFNHQNPRTNIETGIPALWLPFNTEDDLSFAQEFLQGRMFDRIYFTLLPSFARSPDTTQLNDWIELLSQHGTLELLGVNPRTFPADPLAPFRSANRMKALRERYRLSSPLKLDLVALDTLSSQ
jgi:hypothetical protein